MKKNVIKLTESQLKKLVMESAKKVLRESVQNENFQNAVQEVMDNPAAYGLEQVPLKTKVRRGMKEDVVYADFVGKKHFQNMEEDEEGWVVRLGGKYYVLHIYWNVGSPMVPGDDGLSLVVKDFISFQSEQPVSGFDRLGTAEILKQLIARKANKMAGPKGPVAEGRKRMLKEYDNVKETIITPVEDILTTVDRALTSDYYFNEDNPEDEEVLEKIWNTLQNAELVASWEAEIYDDDRSSCWDLKLISVNTDDVVECLQPLGLPENVVSFIHDTVIGWINEHWKEVEQQVKETYSSNPI